MSRGIDTPSSKSKNDDCFAKNSDRGQNPNSKQAIEKHQYKKGESGNIGGRKSKYYKLGKALKKLGGEDVFQENFMMTGEDNLGSRKSLVLKTIWSKAIEGDIKYVELVASLGCLDD